MKILHRGTQVFLSLMAIAFCKVGIETLINPASVLANVGIELTNTSALSSMRAVYGGMHLVFGLFCVYGVFRNTKAALGLIVLYTAGFIIGRVSGILIDGAPNEFVVTWLITEAVSFMIAGLFLLKSKSEPNHA